MTVAMRHRINVHAVGLCSATVTPAPARGPPTPPSSAPAGGSGRRGGGRRGGGRCPSHVEGEEGGAPAAGLRTSATASSVCSRRFGGMTVHGSPETTAPVGSPTVAVSSAGRTACHGQARVAPGDQQPCREYRVELDRDASWVRREPGRIAREHPGRFPAGVCTTAVGPRDARQDAVGDRVLAVARGGATADRDLVPPAARISTAAGPAAGPSVGRAGCPAPGDPPRARVAAGLGAGGLVHRPGAAPGVAPPSAGARRGPGDSRVPRAVPRTGLGTGAGRGPRPVHLHGAWPAYGRRDDSDLCRRLCRAVDSRVAAGLRRPRRPRVLARSARRGALAGRAGRAASTSVPGAPTSPRSSGGPCLASRCTSLWPGSAPPRSGCASPRRSTMPSSIVRRRECGGSGRAVEMPQERGRPSGPSVPAASGTSHSLMAGSAEDEGSG